jgi:glycerol-3-phosphate dehydrogenase (NAD(P)+)
LENLTKISIYGLGNFGYAILKHLDSKNDKKIQLYSFDRNKELVNSIKTTRKHPFLHKSIKISNRIIFTSNVKSLLLDCDILILAIPSKSLRSVLQKIKPHINQKLIIVNTAKALDYRTGKRLSEIADEELKDKLFDYSLIAGGTIAKDLFNQEPLGIDIACLNKRILPFISNLFKKSNLVVYTTTDLKGAEYASALKNVVSILAGIVKGMNFSFGSETHIITRVSSELEKIIVNVLGGNKKTLDSNSQCWTNDLWMSSLGNTRNKEFGVLLGKGVSVNKAISIMKKQGKTIEGISTLKAMKNIPELKNYPLTNFLYRYIILQSTSLEKLKPLVFKGDF